MLVELRVEVPDDMTADLSCMDTGIEDEMASASDASWTTESGDVHYWHP